LSVDDASQDYAVNALSALAAAQQAARSFEKLPATASRTFIYTGNRLNIEPIAPLLSLGMGKSATAHLVASAAQSYPGRGYKYVLPSTGWL